MERKARSVPRRSVASTSAKSAIPAKTARPATCVAGSASSSRWASPAVDQATAATTIASCPSRARRRSRPEEPVTPSVNHGPFTQVGQGYPCAMHVFTRRNAVIGWIVTRIAHKRLERLLNEIAGNPPRPRRRAVGTAVAAGAGAVAGAVVTRHVVGTERRAD